MGVLRGRQAVERGCRVTEHSRKLIESLGYPLRHFVNGYAECAAWCGMVLLEDGYISPEQRGEPFADSVWESFVSDCRAFLEDNREDLDRVNSDGTEPRSWESLGHDFFLSRNGHGAGYFDRGREEWWRRLQDAARPWGDVSFVVEDGELVQA